jgi:hypothetical protein
MPKEHTPGKPQTRWRVAAPQRVLSAVVQCPLRKFPWRLRSGAAVPAALLVLEVVGADGAGGPG